jgi:DNA-binding response OmpR family regulator
MTHLLFARNDKPGRRLVVCIDDEPETISLIKLILERSEFRVMGALDGLDGLDLIRRVRPDVVLLDLMLPGIDGWEVNRRIQNDDRLRNTPVIMLTAAHRTEQDEDDLPVADYITKPFAPRDLVRRIRRTLCVPVQMG